MVDGLMTVYAMISRHNSGGRLMNLKSCWVQLNSVRGVRFVSSISGLLRRLRSVISTPCSKAIVVAFESMYRMDLSSQ